MIHALEVDIHSTGSTQHPVMKPDKIKQYHDLSLNTLGLGEYAERLRATMGISLRDEAYYPKPRIGHEDDLWHQAGTYTSLSVSFCFFYNLLR